jgi:hypothetical protein
MSLIKKIILLIICFVSIASAQVIVLPESRGARNAAMGDALISEPGEISVTFLNPASLAFLKERSLFFNHGQLRNFLGMTENLAVPLLQLSPVALSIGLESYHLGYIGESSEFPGQRIFEFGYNLTAASNVIAPTFSVGVTAGFRRGETSYSKTWAVYYSVGINYSPSADINYGLVLSGLGNDLTYSLRDTILYADRTLPQKKLVVGASMKYPSTSSLRRTIFVLALANEKIFGMSGLLYKAGLELRPFSFLNLRFGYVYGPHISEPRFGLGVNISYFAFEYVYHIGPSPVMLQQFSLSVTL